MITFRSGRVAAVLFVACGSRLLGAQGTLSGQGLGYPAGGIPAHALGTGGAMAAQDPRALINPASIQLAQRGTLYLQYEPEWRSTSVDDKRAGTNQMRFPLFQGIAPLGQRFSVSLGYATLLDRTWRTTAVDTPVVAGVRTPSSYSLESVGAVGETRFAAAWRLFPQVAVGGGVSILTGGARVLQRRSFSDSTQQVGSIASERDFSVDGAMYSVGMVATPVKQVTVAAHASYGARAELRLGDSLATTANAPNRLGLSVDFAGIPGTQLIARWESVQWSRLDGLGRRAPLGLRDTRELAVGADLAGPKWGGYPLGFRVGLRDRTLPSTVLGAQPTERGVSGGVGLPFANGRTLFDVAVQRLQRRAGRAREDAWVLSFGVTVRP